MLSFFFILSLFFSFSLAGRPLRQSSGRHLSAGGNPNGNAMEQEGAKPPCQALTSGESASGCGFAPSFPQRGSGIRQSRMTEEGERDRQQTVKTFAHSPRLRSFSHCGPVTFSLSGRPCGRHPPPLGEGRGESAFDDRHVRRIRSILCRGRRSPRPPQHMRTTWFHLWQIRTRPVGDGVLDVPRSST